MRGWRTGGGRKGSHMLRYRERCLYAVGSKIQGLCENPASLPEASPYNPLAALTWFMASAGIQPDDVNNWVAAQLPGLTAGLVPYTFKPGWLKAIAYMAALDVKITILLGTPFSQLSANDRSAWVWFNDQ